jgi:DNA ligase D-like protein (predicted ligase)
MEPMPLAFIEPMLLLPASTLPEGPNWSYELKLDGYRALAIKTGGAVYLRSRNNKDFNSRYPAIVEALIGLPDGTVIDGEVVALDAQGRPSFNLLQNRGSAASIVYYVFDLMVVAGRDVMAAPLAARRELLLRRVLPTLREPIHYSPPLDASPADLIRSVREHGLEGLVAKRLDSTYEPGQRTGAWRKVRLNRGQEFVIGDYTPSAQNFDALIFGYYDGDRLIYAARTRSGFTPASRQQLFQRFDGLQLAECPLANLPEASGGRWGEGLTAAKMKECRWLKPVVAQVEFVEWTPDNHLRHSRFVSLREDKRST